MLLLLLSPFAKISVFRFLPTTRRISESGRPFRVLLHVPIVLCNKSQLMLQWMVVLVVVDSAAEDGGSGIVSH